MLWPDEFPEFDGQTWAKGDGEVYKPIDLFKTDLTAETFTTGGHASDDLTADTVAKAIEAFKVMKDAEDYAALSYAGGVLPSPCGFTAPEPETPDPPLTFAASAWDFRPLPPAPVQMPTYWLYPHPREISPERAREITGGVMD
jgi:hypothetical protein